MKKLILLLLASALAAPAATFAQKVTVTNINREKTYKTTTHNLDVWYQGELNLGFATGGKLKWDEDGTKDKTDYSRPFLETIHGVRITRYAFVGLGAGVQYAYGKLSPDNAEVEDKWKTLMIPLFVNLKGYYPVSEHFAPYISISLGGSICASSSLDESGVSGYGSSWETKHKGGFYGEYGLGFNYRRLNFEFGLQHQSMKLTETYEGQTEEMKASVNSFFVKVGLKF